MSNEAHLPSYFFPAEAGWRAVFVSPDIIEADPDVTTFGSEEKFVFVPIILWQAQEDAEGAIVSPIGMPFDGVGSDVTDIEGFLALIGPGEVADVDALNGMADKWLESREHGEAADEDNEEK